jgi:hypothetical protein
MILLTKVTVLFQSGNDFGAQSAAAAAGPGFSQISPNSSSPGTLLLKQFFIIYYSFNLANIRKYMQFNRS